MEIEEINQAIRECADTNQISDGYHTFGELYEHRIALFIALCHVIQQHGGYLYLWKSRKHSDGSAWAGWFIAGIGVRQGEQISYHLPETKWDQLHIGELSQAPAFDGHTPDDVLKRIAKLGERPQASNHAPGAIEQALTSIYEKGVADGYRSGYRASQQVGERAWEASQGSSSEGENNNA